MAPGDVRARRDGLVVERRHVAVRARGNPAGPGSSSSLGGPERLAERVAQLDVADPVVAAHEDHHAARAPP